MSNPTTPFGWQMPTNTDLVTDLPADFEVFGQAVATSMADLLGGTTDQVLAKNSNTDLDYKWVTIASGGKLKQVVQATTTAFFSTTSTSLVDITNMSVSITPTANTSKVLVLISCPTLYRGGDNGSLTIRIVRDSTAIWETGLWGVGLNTTNAYAIDFSQWYLDSPATTSSTTYKVQMKINAGTNAAYWNYNGSATEVANITLFEIGA